MLADGTVTINGQAAPTATWQRALARARTERVRVHRDHGMWHATSISHPGELHHVNGRCDCQAGQSGRVCKHTAAVVAARLVAGELVTCGYCGAIRPRSEVHSEWRHVGGRADRLEHYCDVIAGYNHREV